MGLFPGNFNSIDDEKWISQTTLHRFPLIHVFTWLLTAQRWSGDDFIHILEDLAGGDTTITITSILGIFAVFHSGLASLRPQVRRSVFTQHEHLIIGACVAYDTRFSPCVNRLQFLPLCSIGRSTYWSASMEGTFRSGFSATSALGGGLLHQSSLRRRTALGYQGVPGLRRNILPLING